ncbi:hypothetical protein PQBR44_0108 (plasmid) [Pseudomonas putida UWC1]|nr:hypothetical protein PQBR44_0108 [Pseudomonas putida UWC1]
MKTDLTPSEPSNTRYSTIEQIADVLKTHLSNQNWLISQLTQ